MAAFNWGEWAAKVGLSIHTVDDVVARLTENGTKLE